MIFQLDKQDETIHNNHVYSLVNSEFDPAKEGWFQVVSTRTWSFGHCQGRGGEWKFHR